MTCGIGLVKPLAKGYVVPSNSFIGTNFPERILVTSLPGIGGRDCDNTTGRLDTARVGSVGGSVGGAVPGRKTFGEIIGVAQAVVGTLATAGIPASDDTGGSVLRLPAGGDKGGCVNRAGH